MARPTLATIGVYGWTADTFLDALRRAGVRQLLDVRQRRGVRGREYAWANAVRLQAALGDGGPQAGYLSVTCPWSVDLLFNVVRGRWPGGTYGVLCHEVRIFEPGTPGYYYGETAKRSAGRKAAGAAGVALDVVGVPSLLT